MSTCLPVNSVCVDRRIVGNLEPVGLQLLDMNGAVSDIVGANFEAHLIDTISGAVVVADGSVVKDDAGQAWVSWLPQAGDTDTVGTYALYIVETNGSPNRRWPKESGAYLMKYEAE